PPSAARPHRRRPRGVTCRRFLSRRKCPGEQGEPRFPRAAMWRSGDLAADGSASLWTYVVRGPPAPARPKWRGHLVEECDALQRQGRAGGHSVRHCTESDMGRAIEELAHFVAATTWESIPEAVRTHARLVLLDTLGVIIAGSLQPEAAGIRSRLIATGGRGATVY